MVCKKHSLPLTLIFLVTFLFPAGAWPKDSIDWMEADAPPFFIHEGIFKGQGYEDLDLFDKDQFVSKILDLS